jgi:hypothetical protein
VEVPGFSYHFQKVVGLEDLRPDLGGRILTVRRREIFNRLLELEEGLKRSRAVAAAVDVPDQFEAELRLLIHAHEAPDHCPKITNEFTASGAQRAMAFHVVAPV